MADIVLDVEAAPTTPAAGSATGYFDSTTKRWSSKNDAAAVVTYIGTDTADAVSNKTETLAAGTTTIAPLKFTSGTNLTTAQAGAMEYDGNCFYASPGASNRALAKAIHFTTTTADFTGANSTAAQPMFNTTEDVITLPSTTSYLLEISAHIHTTGTANHTFGILFGGTATLTSIGYQATVTNAATEVLGGSQTFWSTSAAVQVLTAATATATHHSLVVTGIVRINAGGTFIPQYQWGTTAPGTAGVTLANSYFKLTPIGSNTVLAVGNWS